MTSESAIDAEPALSVTAVARRLGIAPATLRTWDRRYGVGPTAHIAGSHRRYSPDDVARLIRMRRLLASGLSTADAAARSEITGATPLSLVAPPATDPLADADDLRRGLSRAAHAMDPTLITGLILAALASSDVVTTWEKVVRPVLVEIGETWADDGTSIDIEHTLSGCITTALSRHTAGLEPTSERPVLLACAPGEHHLLPIAVMSAALAERSVGSLVLGQNTPPAALTAATLRVGPIAIMVWSHTDATGDPTIFDAVPALRPRPVLVAGGPGWDDVDLGSTVTRIRGIDDALAAVTAPLR